MPSKTNFFIHALKIANYLSIDVALGTSVNVYYIATVTQTPVNGFTLIELALVTWLIYTADHLIDAFRVTRLVSGRLLFHRKYAYQLIYACLIVGFMGLLVLFWLPDTVLQTGLWLLFYTVIYYILRACIKVPFYKELGVALIYGASVSLLALGFAGDDNLVFIVAYTLLASLNLLLLSKLEAYQDKKQQQTNSYYSVNSSFFQGLWIMIFLTETVLCIYYFELLLPVSIMATIHGVVMIYAQKIYANGYYRILTDGSFVVVPLFFS